MITINDSSATKRAASDSPSQAEFEAVSRERSLLASQLGRLKNSGVDISGATPKLAIATGATVPSEATRVAFEAAIVEGGYDANSVCIHSAGHVVCPRSDYYLQGFSSCSGCALVHFPKLAELESVHADGAGFTTKLRAVCRALATTLIII